LTWAVVSGSPRRSPGAAPEPRPVGGLLNGRWRLVVEISGLAISETCPPGRGQAVKVGVALGAAHRWSLMLWCSFYSCNLI